ncbi:MAG: sporulation protein YqfD [Ruminococcus sp.]|nr:sporulation protein YqfD [Ruminococcus sp.]
MIGAAVRYRYLCPNPQRFFSLVKNNGMSIFNIVQNGEVLTLSVGYFSRKRLEKIMCDLGGEFKIIRLGFIGRLFKSLSTRAGLILGAVVSIAFLIIIQDYAVNIEILSDNEDVIYDVKNVLAAEGITAKSRISQINRVELERSIKQKAASVSWAGISICDSTLIIDVIENIDEPDNRSERMPSNLIASHSGVIEDVVLYNGVLVKTVGSGVIKGETLVSGTIEIEKTSLKEGKVVTETNRKYVRSIGEIYGTYSDTQTFEQSYIDTSIVYTGKSLTKHYLDVFSAEIPLFISSPSGYYSQQSEYTSLEILGKQTPVGIRTSSYQEYRLESVMYTKEQAVERVNELKQAYENSFLSNCEIKSERTDIKYTDDGVSLTVTYEIYGLMSEESKLFIKKE